MRKGKKIFFIICFVCFISVFIGYRYVNKNEYDYTKQGFYDECTNYNENIETVNKQSKVSVNTEIVLTDKYLLCNHEVDNKVDVDISNINKTYEEIEKQFNDYSIKEFNDKYIRLYRKVDSYCPFHYILKQKDSNISVYKKIDELNNILLDNLDLNYNSLRENDKKLFIGEGLEIYGQKELYELIEDFDS